MKALTIGPPAISAEVLSAVKLKPAARREPSNSFGTVPAGFDSDLRNALAKRKNKASHS